MTRGKICRVCTTASEFNRRARAGDLSELREVLVRRRGNLRATAFELGIGRKTLYRILDRASLWLEVERARERPRSAELR